MVTTTTVYSFQKPDVSGDEDAWGGYLNANVDKYESILTGNTTITSLVITTADINGGTLDNVVIGGSTAAAVTGTTITGTGFASTGNMTFGDNNKALFGSSSDLEVYHNGTNSVIYDNGTGNLQLVSGGASVDIIKAGGENMANFATDGAVTLYYDNAVKITTASTGAIILHDNNNYDDGLTLRSTKNWGYGTSLSFDAIATSGGSNATVGKIQSRWQSTGNHALDFYTYGSGSLTKRARLDNEGNLGVGGNTSPSSYNTSAHQLVIGNGSDSQGITIATGTSTYGNIFFADGTSGAAAYAGFIQYTHDTDKLYFGTSGSNRVVIDSSGIDVTGTVTADLLNVTSGSSADNIVQVFGGGTIYAGLGVDGTGAILTAGSSGSADAALIIKTSASGTEAERLRISSDGSVGIGTSSPTANLHLSGSGARKIDITDTGGANTRISTASNNSYVGCTTNHPLLFITNDTERMRISSDGSVGIGTSPSSHLHVKSTSDNIVATRVSTNSVDALFQSIESASLAQIGTVGSHAFTFFTANQERMRINSSGDVGIGTASPTSFSTFRYLDIVGSATTSGGVLQLRTSDFSVNCTAYASSAGGYLGTSTNHNLYFLTNNSTRAMIDSSGNFLVGKTSDNFAVEGTAIRGSTSGSKVTITRDGNNALALNRLTSDGSIITFNKQGSAVGSISVTSSATAYNTSSDRRLKENILDANNTNNLIDAIQVRQFDWKTDGSHQRYGLVAQELNDVFPEAVSIPDNEEEMQSVDYSKLVPMLVKEIQSLRNRITELEAN